VAEWLTGDEALSGVEVQEVRGGQNDLTQTRFHNYIILYSLQSAVAFWAPQ
jgi:hypothetical protein